MALGDPYAYPEELEVRLGREDDGTFLQLLAAASRQVEAYCGRQFNMTTEATERRFRALDVERLPVDDFHTTAGLVVEVNGVVWDGGNYEPRPWNNIINGEAGWPFFDLLAIGRNWPIARRPTIHVTAQWGWAAVPAGIVEATLDVAQWMASSTVSSSAGASTGIITRESVDGYSVSFAGPGSLTVSSNVPGLLVKAEPYRRKRFGVA